MDLKTVTMKGTKHRARKRIGRGIGSGSGKTSGRGHKGLGARSGSSRKPGFEGGQMPLQRRVPKRGFRSMHRGRGAEVRLHELTLVAGGEVDLAALKAAGVVNRHALRAKVIASGKIDTPVTLRGVGTTAGARKAIEQAGGRVED